MRSDQPTGADVAIAADTPETTPDLAPESYPAGARIHQAVRAVGGASKLEPPAGTQPPARVKLPEPHPNVSDPSMDLFGASAATPDSEPPSESRTATPEATDTVTEEGDLVVDLRSTAGNEAIPARDTIDLSDTRTWADAPQGWVRNSHGGLDWQPVVTATDRLDRWEVDVPLGLVSVDVMLFGAISGERVAQSRQDAVNEMVAETLRRGGHAVVSVAQSVTQLDGSLLVTATGTAATLRDRTSARR